jgi:hypothetical protein
MWLASVPASPGTIFADMAGGLLGQGSTDALSSQKAHIFNQPKTGAMFQLIKNDLQARASSLLNAPLKCVARLSDLVVSRDSSGSGIIS